MNNFLIFPWSDIFQIVSVDLFLGFDNVLAISLIAKTLSVKSRLKAIIIGTAIAIVSRMIMIFFASALLDFFLLKLICGLILFRIAIQFTCFSQVDTQQDFLETSPHFLDVIKKIIITDLVMSLDNILAIAAIVQNSNPEHSLLLISCGLLLSIPIMFCGGQMILKVFDQFPAMILFAGGMLGWIGTGLIISDPLFGYLALFSTNFQFSLLKMSGALFVFILSIFFKKRLCRS